MYYIQVDGHGSNFCLNLQPPRDHNSNRIWFSLDKYGMKVRCFCRCLKTEGRKLGMCKDYASPSRELSDNDKIIMFPEKQNIKKTSDPFLCQKPSSLLEQIHAEMFPNERPKKKQKNDF